MSEITGSFTKSGASLVQAVELPDDTVIKVTSICHLTPAGIMALRITEDGTATMRIGDVKVCERKLVAAGLTPR